MRGSKILYMSLKKYGVRFVDTLNYLAMPLKRIPAAMGLNIRDLKKGTLNNDILYISRYALSAFTLSRSYIYIYIYISFIFSVGDFPLLFNLEINKGVILQQLPALRYFMPDSRSTEDRAQLVEWYEENKHRPFDVDAELLRYCEQDVRILSASIKAFNELFIEITTDADRAPRGIPPFQNSFTIASACNRLYRQLYLEPETIALIPSNGNPKRMQSAVALRWLRLLNAKHNFQPQIRHSANSGEKKIMGKYFVDGYRKCPETGQQYVYEFLG